LSQTFSSWYFSWTSGDPHRSGFKLHIAHIIIIIIIIIAIELSLGGSSPYTSTDKTNKNKYT